MFKIAQRQTKPLLPKPHEGSLRYKMEQQFGEDTIVHVALKVETREYGVSVWLPNRQGVVFTIPEHELEDGTFPTKTDWATLLLLAHMDPLHEPNTRGQSKAVNQALSRRPRR